MLDQLKHFIVEAKAAAYVGGGATLGSSRPGSHDLGHARGDWRYLDSYYGGTDFIGQETVWLRDEPVWAMNYYGRILRPDLIDASRAGTVIKTALAALYLEGRFLGGFRFELPPYLYLDRNEGSHESFTGIEIISSGGVDVYRLDYHGGLVRA